MKRILTLFFGILLFAGTSVYAQQDTLTIKRSQSKVVIAGQVYYVHIVKEGESLPAISEAYGVSQKNIAKENPEIILGIQVGQALKIPYVKPVHKYSPATEKTSADIDFVLYEVKAKETVFSLHRKFGIPRDTIYAMNPKVEDEGLKAGQYIKLPKSIGQDKYTLADAEATGQQMWQADSLENRDDFIYHKVQPQETIFRLKQTYNVSEEDLHEYNPVLKEGLKYGMVLKIPRQQDTTFSVLFTGQDTARYDSGRELIGRKPFDAYFSKFCPRDAKLQGNFKVALFMPLFLDKNSEEFYIDSSKFADDGKRIYERKYYPPDYVYRPSKGFVEFYQGFLLAVDSLKQAGVSVELHVFDSARDSMKVKQILNNPELAQLDLIVGPAYREEADPIMKFAKQYQIPVVSPFSRDMDQVYSNPFYFQVFPSFVSRMETFTQRIAHLHAKNLVLIHAGDTTQKENIALMKEKLFNQIEAYTFLSSVQFKEVVFKDSISVIEQALVPGEENIIIAPSNNEAFVTDLVTNLNTLYKKGYTLRLFGLSRWQRFENVDPIYYFNLNLSIIQVFLPDYTQPACLRFIEQYSHAFKGEPTQFAFHGYDVGMYFVSALGRYGRHFSRCMHQHQPELLQGKFSFVKWTPESGFENNEVFWLDYLEGYRIERIGAYKPSVYSQDFEF